LDLQALGPIGMLTTLGRESGESLPADFPFDWIGRALESGCQFSTSPPFSLGRLLGVALDQTGRGQAAVDAFSRAAETAECGGARAELALINADRGMAMVRSGRSGSTDEALLYLHKAISDFEELGMWGAKHALVRSAAVAGVSLPREPGGPDYPDLLDEDDMSILEAFALGREPAETAADLLLDRQTVARRRTLLLDRLGLAGEADALSYLEAHGLEPTKRRRAPDRFDEPSGHVFLFTDIDNSTPLNSVLGDQRYVRLLALHDHVIEEAVSTSGGNVVKHTGDGYFVEFAGADAAVECALAIQERFPLMLPESPDHPMAVGIGLHAGGAIAHGFDFTGVAVITAARICAAASGGEILASSDVRAATSAGRAHFVDRGKFSLKGFVEQVRVYSVGGR